MRIYQLWHDTEEYQSLTVPDEAEDEILRALDGTPCSAGWVPITVAVYHSEETPPDLKPSDYPALGWPPVFSRRAIEGLWDLLEPNGEMLPVLCDGGEYLIFNVTTISDALDEKQSHIHRYRDGRIFDVFKYSFFPEKLGDAAIFQVTQLRRLWIFVTEEFVQRVQNLGLVGFEFKLVWEG